MSKNQYKTPYKISEIVDYDVVAKNDHLIISVMVEPLFIQGRPFIIFTLIGPVFPVSLSAPAVNTDNVDRSLLQLIISDGPVVTVRWDQVRAINRSLEDNQ